MNDAAHGRNVLIDLRRPQERVRQSPVVSMRAFILQEEPGPADVSALLKEVAPSIVPAVLYLHRVNQGRVIDEHGIDAIDRHPANRTTPEDFLHAAELKLRSAFAPRRDTRGPARQTFVTLQCAHLVL
jgi:hypothetical protein